MFLISHNLYCRDSIVTKSNNDTIYYKNVLEPGEVVLKYKEILVEESKAHRDFLETIYSKIVYLIGILGTLLVGLIYFVWGRTKREIRSQVDYNFQKKVDEIIKEQTELIEASYKRKLNNFTNYTKNLLIDLTSKAVIKAGDKPLRDIDYETLKGKRILWVDDKPDNNLQHREVFSSFGVQFVIAKTTGEAKKSLDSANSFDLIISNMGRQPNENEADNPREGLVFLKFLEDKNIKTPKIIYTKPANVENYSDEVNKLHASITQGYTGLFKEILRNIAK